MNKIEFKTGYYQADVACGVTYVGNTLEDANADVLNPIDFMDSLDCMRQDEVLYTFLDESTQDIFNKLVSLYGIH